MEKWVPIWICLLISWGPCVEAQAPGSAPVEVFLDAKEQQVRFIAGNATNNYENSCELLSTCESPKNCSKGACEFVSGEVERLVCASIINNTNCRSTGDAICNYGLLSYEESFVRFPLNSSGIGPEVKNALCSQRELDKVFRPFGQQDRGGTEFFNYAFGSVDGSHRFYPGRAVPNCHTYDVRQRPWYNGAMSVKKNLLILLDSSQSMGSIQGAVTSASSFLQIGISTTLQLLHTLTPTDQASVVTFDATASAVELGQFSVPIAGLDPGSPDLLSLVEAVEDVALSRTQGPANITAGFSLALSKFVTGPSDAMKVVVVLTDGKFGDSVNATEIQTVLEGLVEHKVFVLMYSIGVPSPTNIGNITSIACALNGSYEAMSSLQNPLFGVRSLFSFFARAVRAKSDKTFWQPRYEDFDGLGPVIEVTYSAMSRDGRDFVGVAGIEVQVQSLNLLLQGSIDNALLNRQAGQSVINPNGEGADLSCTFPESNSIPCTSAGLSTGMCPQTDFKNGLTQRACCSSCGGIRSKPSSKNHTAIYVGVVISVAVIAIILAGTLYIKRAYRKGDAFKPPDVPSAC